MHKKLIDAAIIVLLAFFIIAASFAALFNYTGFYRHEFEKTGTYGRVPDADAVFANLHSYLNGREALNESDYTQREIMHLHDVRQLMLYFYAAFAFITILLISSFFYRLRCERCKAKLLSGIFLFSPSILILLLLILMLFDFTLLFTAFHKILFSNDFWLLPPDSTLIKLFPKQFFYDFAVKMLTLAAAVCILSYILGIYLALKKNNPVIHRKL